MVPTTISTKKLAKFKDIRDRFLATTPLPVVGKWRLMSDETLWLRVVSQVVVVGNEAPAKRLQCTEIQAHLAFYTLANSHPTIAANAIGSALAAIGTRYVSRTQPTGSPKVNALLKNLAVLKAFNGGPRGLVGHLAGMKTSRDRIDYLSKNFSYFKAKGARDFLATGLGMASDVIALDSRVMGIVRRIVPELPVEVNARNYDAIERFLIKRVCQPLKMSGMEFDQLLFHNKDAIEKQLGGGRSRGPKVFSNCRAGKRPVAAEMDCRQCLS
jgi:hypothetical protein